MKRNHCIAAALIMLLLIMEVVSPAFICRAEENQQSLSPVQDEIALYTQYLQEQGYSDMLSYSLFEDDWSVEATEELVDAYSMNTCLIDLNRDGVCELLVVLEDEEAYMSRSALLTIDNGAVKLVAAAGDDGGSIGGSRLELKYNSALQEYAAVKIGVIRDGAHAFFNDFTLYSNDALFSSHALQQCGYDLSTDYSKEADAIRAETDLWLTEDGYFYACMLDDQYVSATLYSTLVNSFADPADPTGLFAPGSYASPVSAALSN